MPTSVGDDVTLDARRDLSPVPGDPVALALDRDRGLLHIITDAGFVATLDPESIPRMVVTPPEF